MTLSAVVICGNEEANIGDCLESLTWCDEIVVVDSQSTDRTVEIAKKYTDKVIVRAWPGYVAQKQFALEQATGDWILSLDADERCTPALKDEIQRTLANPGDVNGFAVKRHVWYLGRWINHGGWYPDYKVRLVRRGKARWTGIDPHDKLEAEGETRRLDGELIHFTYRDFSHQLKTIDKFSDVAVEEWIKEGRRFSWIKFWFHPPVKFFVCYVWKLGFLDGWAGLVIAAASAFYVRTKYVKLRERQLRLPERRP
jgi:glycosyltransferase involved in cell wall biosynthesis